MLNTWLLVIVWVLTINAQRTAETASQHNIQGIPSYLTEHHFLQVGLQSGVRDEQKNEEYVALMRQLEVRRALFELQSVWRAGKAQNVRVVRRMYFIKNDGPHAQLRRSESLKAIQTSGLETLLDHLAMERVKQAPFFGGFEGPNPEGKQMYSFTEFFADPSLSGEKTFVSPIGKNIPPLDVAARLGDANNVEELLQARKFSRKEVDNALFAAAGPRRDNSDVIDLLIGAGANINARKANGMTPLMYAVDSPTQVLVLLERGAHIDDKDNSGKTALKLAKERHDTESAKILLRAGARE
jgi:hypothetical protein